jgi:phage terminase small subunit
VWNAVWSAAWTWLDPKSDALLVELVARKASEIARMERRLVNVDAFYATKSGAILPHPGFAQLRAAQAQFVAWSALLGLNPSTRSELNVNLNVEVDELKLFRMRNLSNRATPV